MKKEEVEDDTKTGRDKLVQEDKYEGKEGIKI